MAAHEDPLPIRQADPEALEIKRRRKEGKDVSGKMSSGLNKRSYIDLASFVEIAPGVIRAMKYNEMGVVYVEVWTGDATENPETLQVVQSGHFQHGSVAFAGGDIVVDTADMKSKKAATKVVPVDTPAPKAEERSGRIITGVALWTARLWRMHFSAKDSSAILVRQLEHYYLLTAPGGALKYEELPAEKCEKSYVRLAM